MFPMTITPSSINILFDGRMRTYTQGHLNYAAVRKLLLHLTTSPDDAGALSELRDIIDIPSFIAKITDGRVRISDNSVMFDDEVVHGVISDRLLSMLKEGFDVRPLARFLQRLKENPSVTAINELYLWLESGNLPMTEDGCFLAFKKVRHDYTSVHPSPDGTHLRNAPGDTPEMPREEVDNDRNALCSRGLHFCSWQYLPSMGGGGESRVVVLKIAPEDVVAIPHDYNNSKGRAWRYSVLMEVPEDECRELFADRSVVSAYGLYDSGDDLPEQEEEEDEDEEYYYHDEPYAYAKDEAEDYYRPEPHAVDEDEDEDDESTEETAKVVSGVMECDDVCNDGFDGTADVEFKCGSQIYTAAQVIQNVEDWGQRGFAKMSGIPRTTIQDWLKKAKA